MHRKKQFTNYVKFTLKCNKILLLNYLSNLRKLVKSVALDGQLFHKLMIRLLKILTVSLRKRNYCAIVV